MRPKVLIIIPAYNEQEAILSTACAVEAYGYDYVIVNDGSKDDTLSICRENGLNVLDLPQNLGIGGAVQTGHKYALRYGYDIDIQVDGDGQHDPQYLHLLVEEIERGADLAIGSRFVEESRGFQSTALRRLGITWFKVLLGALTGTSVTDATSGFRACGRKAIKLFSESYPIDYPEPESIALALKRGLRVREVPVSMRERQGGQSSIGGLSSIYFMVKVTLAICVVCLANGRKKK